jgi:serine/threonine protein phosphatase PrpC
VAGGTVIVSRYFDEMLATSEIVTMRRHRTAKDPPATWAASQVGPREENQDDYGRADHTVSGYRWRETGCLYVLADGMGGLQSGHEAAQIAVQAVVAEYGRHPDSDDVAASIARAVEHANQCVLGYAEERGVRTGSTVVACVLKDGVATIAHVGDSRLYHFHGGELRRCTVDHLYATEILGAVDDDEVKRSPDGHKISRALGQEADVRVTVSEVEYSSSDRFLLCSDGLSEAVEYAEIHQAMTAPTPKQVVRALFAAAQNRLTDNATAIVVFTSGRRVRTRWLMRMASASLLATSILVGAALGAVAAWRTYLRPLYVSRGTAAASQASPTSSAEELRLQTWTSTSLSNLTSHSVYVWKDDDRSWRLALSPNEPVRFEFVGGSPDKLWWCYQADKPCKFRKRIEVQEVGKLKISDDGAQLWQRVGADQEQGAHSNVGSETGRARRPAESKK